MGDSSCQNASRNDSAEVRVSDILNNEYRKCAEPIIKGNMPEALKHISETRDLPSITPTERMCRPMLMCRFRSAHQA